MQAREIPDQGPVARPQPGGGAQILTGPFQVAINLTNIGHHYHHHHDLYRSVTRRVLVNKGEEGEVEGTHGLQMLDGSPLARLPTIPRFKLDSL